MKLSKFNKYNWLQERNVIITQDCIYNYKYKSMKPIKLYTFAPVEIKRVIPLVKLSGFTRSLHPASKEFVIHVFGEHDYRMKSEM